MASADVIERVMARGGGSSPIVIKPDPEYVFLEGLPSEMSDETFDIKGQVEINVAHRMPIKALKASLSVTAKSVRSRPKERGHSNSIPPVICTEDLHSQEMYLVHDDGSKVLRLDGGRNVFNFCWKVPGHIPETVVGVTGAHVRYEMKVEVFRGFFGQNFKNVQPIRVIRTVSPNSESLRDPVSVENVWAEKGLKYALSTTSHAAPLGDVVILEFLITKLEPKVQIKNLGAVLTEHQRIRSKPTPDCRDGYIYRGLQIKHDVFEMPDEPTDTDPITGDSRYKITKRMLLPISLSECRPSVPDGEWIKITHDVQLHINVLNADGHVSRIKPSLNIRLFISPRRAVFDFRGTPALSENPAAHETLMDEQTVDELPYYGNSHLDQLFAGVSEGGGDQSGGQTPIPFSNSATPGAMTPAVLVGSGSHSEGRRGSADAAAHLMLQARLDEHSEDLTRRLRGLQFGQPTVPGVGGDMATSPETPYASGSLARSGQSHLVTGYNMEELERLESYDAAVRTPRIPTGDGPPSYFEATSRPPSPSATIRAQSTIGTTR